jgi:L-ribulokinase
VAATGSTPLPLDAHGSPLALDPAFAADRSALAWLWKDHTAHAEAAEITAGARELRPHYLARCGGTYSSEWFWAKALHCRRVAPAVFRATHTWVELCDWVPALLCGVTSAERIVRGVCAAGHKAMYHTDWGGLPDPEFLATLDPELGELQPRCVSAVKTVQEPAGHLCAAWAERTGLPAGLPVATGALDAHLGAVGSGIRPGRLVKILGTSTCDMLVVPGDESIPDIPGLCGIVPSSILPGYHGLEAGQSAVGDIFGWYVASQGGGDHEALTAGARQVPPGTSGLLALDWHNGNRTVLVDPRLTGLLVGQTLHTTPAEVYRALIEATAFGALTIMQRLEEYGATVTEVVTCGGIADRNPLVLEIHASVTGRPMRIAGSPETCALGAALCGAVVGGAFPSLEEAQDHMTALSPEAYLPDPDAHAIYTKLFRLYSDLHDAFGTTGWTGNLQHVMKQLLEIKERARASQIG